MTLAGCGPIEYINQVSFKAGAAVRAARLAHADQAAPYEMVAAEEYLLKAREEAGRSEYQAAIAFGEKAEEMANKARAIALAPRKDKGGPENTGPVGAPAAAPEAKPAANAKPAGSGAAPAARESGTGKSKPKGEARP